MTILEAIQANPVFSDLSVNAVQFALDSRSVNGSTTYAENYLKDVELVSADLYLHKALLPEYKEGQLSVKYDVSLLKDRAKALYFKYNDAKASEFEPRVINVGVTAVDAQ